MLHGDSPDRSRGGSGRTAAPARTTDTGEAWARGRTRSVEALDRTAKRAIDIAVALALLVVLSPLCIGLAIAIKLDSRGPVFYRAHRVGRFGQPVAVLKFRKMADGAQGPALTVSADERLTRVGRFLAEHKLDELPQLLNVVRGDMSLVGPRPEDRTFVELHAEDYANEILTVRPGITGLTQLAFAHEGRVLHADDRERDYRERLLPLKVELDRLYVAKRSVAMDLSVLAWTTVAIVLDRDVAVHRETGRLGLRRRQLEQARPAERQFGHPASVASDDSARV